MVKPRKEPRPRKDGLCFVCKKQIVIALVKGVPDLQRVDAFCSTQCAKSYFQVDYSTRSSVPV